MNAFDLVVNYAGFALEARATWDATRTTLFGASGSGKTTVLEAMAGVRRDVRGRVELAGRRVDALPARRRRVGWVPQEGLPSLRIAMRAPACSAASSARRAPWTKCWVTSTPAAVRMCAVPSRTADAVPLSSAGGRGTGRPPDTSGQNGTRRPSSRQRSISAALTGFAVPL